jgi:hypothetical protein
LNLTTPVSGPFLAPDTFAELLIYFTALLYGVIAASLHGSVGSFYQVLADAAVISVEERRANSSQMLNYYRRQRHRLPFSPVRSAA